MREVVTFYKKRRDWPGAVTGVLMASVWWLGEATLQSVQTRSVGPLLGYVRGAAEGARQPLRGGAGVTAPRHQGREAQT